MITQKQPRVNTLPQKSFGEKPLPHSPEAERALLSGIQATSPEQRLLDFMESLILDAARTCPRVRDLDVALWIARVAVGAKK